MNIQHSLVCCLVLLSNMATAQTQPPKGSITYSPYTPQQLQEFNQQALAPSEGPFGPVDTPPQDRAQTNQPPKDSKYFSPPEGEEEAEALETQSAEPYTPSTPIYRF